MTPWLRAMQRIALVCGVLLVLLGSAFHLRTYILPMPMHHDMAGVGTGPDTVGLIGTLLITQGVLMVLAGLFVLRPASGHAAPSEATGDAADSALASGSPAERPQPSASHEVGHGVGHREGSANALDVRAAKVVTIGGGLGSFALVDRLRIAGVAASDVVVVSTTTDPTARFAELCRSSGMREGDRLRSDSSARMDNIWGFPGYAASEAHQCRNPMPVLRTMLEPVTASYTPTVGLLVDGVKREAQRIGWGDMVATGEAYRVTELPGGDYLVLVHREGQRDLAIQTRWVHLALGSTGPRLPVTSRGQLGPDRVAHVYEPHEEIHRALRRHGGSVLVRGSGIEASRVLERLITDRDSTGSNVHIWQLFDTYHAAPSGPVTQRHDAGHGFHYQRDTFPKAAYGGQIHDEVRRLDEPDRIELIQRLGATSTPYRSDWARQLRRGRAEGWYDAVVGELADLGPHQDGVTATILLATKERLELNVDHVIDATGLDTYAEHHELVRDLVEEGLGELNELGCLRVDDSFCVSRAGNGGIVASGMTATGAPLAPVDSFLGLQSAAFEIARTLADSGVGQPLTPLRSIRSWWSWMEGASL